MKGYPAIHHAGKLVIVPHFMNKNAVNAYRKYLYPKILEFLVVISNC
jgi:hypothetical protein